MAAEYEYVGWVYHIGVNSVRHEYAHLRFLTIRGKSVAMYKRDPHDNPGIDFYVWRLYNPMDQNMKGQIACATPGEVSKWLEAFEEARLQAEFDMMSGDNWNENEINFDGHRPRLRRYVYGLGKYIRISKSTAG